MIGLDTLDISSKNERTGKKNWVRLDDFSTFFFSRQMAKFVRTRLKLRCFWQVSKRPPCPAVSENHGNVISCGPKYSGIKMVISMLSQADIFMGYSCSLKHP